MIDKFKRFLASRSRSPITIDKYSHAVEDFGEYLQLTGTSLTKAPPGALDGFITWLATSRKLAPASIHQEIAGVRVFVKFAKTLGLALPEFAPPTMPKVGKRLPLVLQQQHLDTYLRLALGVTQPYRTALMILPFCGLRVNEISNLRLGDLEVQKSPQGKPRIVFSIIGKGNKQRRVPVFSAANPVLLSYVTGWLKQYHAQAKAKANVPEAQRWLFPGPRAHSYRQIDRQRVEDLVAAMRPRVGLRGLKPHVMRATYLTALLSIGIPMHEAARYAGHSSVQTLFDHYAGHTIQNAAAIFGDVYRLI